MFAGGEMIKIGISSTTPAPDQETPEQPKERIPFMAIPVTLAVGLLVAGGYVGNRVFASRGHATTIIPVRPEPAADSVAKPTAFGPTPAAAQTQAHPAVEYIATAAQVATAPTAVSTPAGLTAAAAPTIAAKTEPTVPKSDVHTAPVEVVTNPENSGEVSAQDKALGLIAPQHGERYLQIAAISSPMVPSFLADLKKYNVQASVAPGPHDGLVRIVIGPFSDQDSTARAKDQIQTKWPDCFVRLY